MFQAMDKPSLGMISLMDVVMGWMGDSMGNSDYTAA
jgi:hypothetical protein